MKEDEISEIKRKAKELEDILLSTDEVTATSGEKVLPPISCAKPLNYDDIKTECDDKSDSIVDSIVSMYIPVEFAKEHDYIHEKMSIDKITISSLLFQMKTSEHAIKRLLEEIDAANVNQRTFADLSQLQKSKMEIVKHFASFMVTMENNYKSLKFDYHSNTVENKQLGQGQREFENRQGNIPEFSMDDMQDISGETITKYRGTKHLMAGIQSGLNQEAQSNGEEQSK